MRAEVKRLYLSENAPPEVIGAAADALIASLTRQGADRSQVVTGTDQVQVEGRWMTVVWAEMLKEEEE